MEERFSVIRGEVEIGCRRLGSGPPLVVVNGYAATNLDWDPRAGALIGAFLGR